MLDVSWHAEAAKQARILQIVVAAMLGGCLFFLLIALTIATQVHQASKSAPATISLVAVVVFACVLVARCVFVRYLTWNARRQIVTGTYHPCPEARYLITVFQSKTIGSAAMFEGCGFLAIIAYLVEGNPSVLGLAVLMLLLIAAHFPTPSRAIEWVERQLDLAKQTGDLG